MESPAHRLFEMETAGCGGKDDSHGLPVAFKQAAERCVCDCRKQCHGIRRYALGADDAPILPHRHGQWSMAVETVPTQFAQGGDGGEIDMASAYRLAAKRGPAVIVVHEHYLYMSRIDAYLGIAAVCLRHTFDILLYPDGRSATFQQCRGVAAQEFPELPCVSLVIHRRRPSHR